MEKYSNILLLSGNGRNSGKTTLGSKIIQHNIASGVIALKISPHIHFLSYALPEIKITEDYQIYLETNSKTKKDSSRYLFAGARRSYYMQCEDDHIAQAFNDWYSIIDQNEPIVIESGGLAKIIKPGLHIFCQGETEKPSINAQLADIIISPNEHFDIRTIEYKNYTWKTNPRKLPK